MYLEVRNSDYSVIEKAIREQKDSDLLQIELWTEDGRYCATILTDSEPVS
jgi:hypothetical protein